MLRARRRRRAARNRRWPRRDAARNAHRAGRRIKANARCRWRHVRLPCRRLHWPLRRRPHLSAMCRSRRNLCRQVRLDIAIDPKPIQVAKNFAESHYGDRRNCNCQISFHYSSAPLRCRADAVTGGRQQSDPVNGITVASSHVRLPGNVPCRRTSRATSVTRRRASCASCALTGRPALASFINANINVLGG
jgi:hypothetical protein